MAHLALVSAIAAGDLDPDLDPLAGAFEHTGSTADIVCWDDPAVNWTEYDAVVLRSTWDYPQRVDEFLAWAEEVARSTYLINDIEVVRWNIDKRYLAALAGQEIPIVPTVFAAPGDSFEWPDAPDVVVKPSISAGSLDTARFDAASRSGAMTLVESIWATGRTALIQPYIASVDTQGEDALVFIDQTYSHSFHKGPLLRPGRGPTDDHLFAAETITATTVSQPQLELGEAALHAAAEITGVTPIYARVDLVEAASGPAVLELELIEPSLYHHIDPSSAARFAGAVLGMIGS